MLQQHIKIRNHVPSDWNFMYATYLRNNWYDKTNSTTLKKDHWMKLQNKRLTNVFQNQIIKIACNPEDDDQIFGYAFEDGIKPFIYVKLAFRKYPIKEMLLKSLEELKHD